MTYVQYRSLEGLEPSPSRFASIIPQFLPPVCVLFSNSKAFEDDPNIDKITYDCEAGGFFCYGKDIDMMIDFGTRFRALLNDEDTFYELICKALPEGMTQETGMNM